MIPSFNDYLTQGNPWLFFPVAVFLGALHGLEPGHSKTMMTAYIVAIRGTVWQAFLLGVSATLSHTAVIWVLAWVGFHYSTSLDIEGLEPYFQLATGVIVVGLGAWMLYRTRVSHNHVPHHHDEGPHGGMMVATRDGLVEISIFETDAPPRFRVYFYDARKNPLMPLQTVLRLETIRAGGAREEFTLTLKDSYLEAERFLPEPHEFEVSFQLPHDDHAHTYHVMFHEHHHHDHAHDAEEYTDDHEREHALQLRKQLTGQSVTTPQIVLFGLTGGLLPCPSAFAVLLVCLQLKKVTLGFMMVLAFSLGLAITLVTVGTLAALSVHHAAKRFKGFGRLALKLPYASSAVMIAIGCWVAIEGLRHIL